MNNYLLGINKLWAGVRVKFAISEKLDIGS